MKARKSGLNLAFTGTIKDELLDKEEIAFYLLKHLLNNELQKICLKYQFEMSEIKGLKGVLDNENQFTIDIMGKIGRKRGALISRTEK